MRSFDLTEQIERLTASGLGRIQRIQDDVYRKLWPKTVELPERHEGRFDRALIVDAYPLTPMYHPVDHGGRRESLPVRLVPMPRESKPTMVVFGREDREAVEPVVHAKHGEILRYVIFWQAGERWKTRSPNAMRSRFDADECGLRLNEGLHLALQEEALMRARRIALAAHMSERGETHFAQWDSGSIPSFTTGYGMFSDLDGVPSRAKDVIVVSTEDQDFFLKD